MHRLVFICDVLVFILVNTSLFRYMMTRCTVVDPYKAGGWVVAGYIKHRQLPVLEVMVDEEHVLLDHGGGGVAGW